VGHLDRREDLVTRSGILIRLNGRPPSRTAVRRPLNVDVVITADEALIRDVDDVIESSTATKAKSASKGHAGA
jgi:hypothetical protein